MHCMFAVEMGGSPHHALASVCGYNSRRSNIVHENLWVLWEECYIMRYMEQEVPWLLLPIAAT